MVSFLKKNCIKGVRTTEILKIKGSGCKNNNNTLFIKKLFKCY